MSTYVHGDNLTQKQALVWLKEMKDGGRLIARRGANMEALANEVINDIDDDFDWE